MAATTIKVIKLITGDEIIGIVQDGRDLAQQVEEGYTTENLLFITAPLKIISEYDNTIKAHTLFLTDWVPSIEDDTVPVDKRQVVTLGNPNVDLEAHYYELVLAKELKEQARREQTSTKTLPATKETESDSEEEQIQKLIKGLKEDDYDDEDLN